MDVLPASLREVNPCVSDALNDSLAKMKEYDRMLPKTARVLRDGRMMVVDAVDLVVGDIVALPLCYYFQIFLKPDSVVPADCRLIDCKDHLQVDRSYFFTENPVMECYSLQ